MLPQPFILQLPLELCEKVIIEGQLSSQDVGSLRLTCTALAAIARPALIYSKVVLSRLRSDRDEFEKAVQDHRIYVQEIIWQGLDLDSWAKDDQLWQGILRRAHPNSMFQRLVRDPKLLWIPIRWQRRIWDKDWKNMWQASADWISEQIESMPNVTTLTIKPMPDIRVFGKTFEEGFDSGHYNEDRQFDFAVVLYVLLQPWCRVRTLNLDTRLPRRDFWDAKLYLEDSSAFQHLTSINICAIPRHEWSRHYFDSLLVHLKRAKNLRSLKLCFSDVPSKWNCTYRDTRFLLWDLFKKRRWPHLQSLHLVNAQSFHMVGRPLPLCCLPELRHLTLDNCDVKHQWIDDVRIQQTYPRLELITIRAEAKCCRKLTSEARILAYLKNEVADLDISHMICGEIVTDLNVPPCQLCSACTKE
ncbi:hypothetical protein F4679DRAFT_542177 [Xylaria curta]|nr:hypothetical protein F4679DRAFT_542177 [Xylaria curta]